jgi:hypothetical protein
MKEERMTIEQIEGQKRSGAVHGARSTKEVAAYLPSNYEAVGEATGDDGRLIVYITGVDRNGWTFDEYVTPRLASGMMYTKETK